MVKTGPNPKNVWFCVVAYRWIALLHILIMLLLGATATVSFRANWFLFWSAVLYTAIITVYRNAVFEHRTYWPLFLAIDLLVIGLLQSFGGGWRSAWYLYSISPILTAAFFYQIKGALVIAAVSCCIYMFSIGVNGYGLLQRLLDNNLDDIISNLFSYFLIAIFFAYPCVLFDRLMKTRTELAAANRDLEHSKKQLDLFYKVSPLTRREIDVLKMLAESKSNKEIAAGLFISEETVKTHVKNIFKKLDFKSRTEAANYFWRLD
jgi:DNA-binding CsgD family transcriptional regulator